MPIPRLNLDNRTFDDLVEELRALIPQYCPDWTNHNASDPGITLVELFAWIAEGLIYRTNRIPEASHRALLELLNVERKEEPLDDARAKAIAGLTERWRAVTLRDFEEIVLKNFASIARASAIPDRALDTDGPDVERIGHLTVVIVPTPTGEADSKPFPSQTLMDEVYALLDKRRLITCRHHIAGPVYTDIALSAEVVCNPGQKIESVLEEVIKSLRSFFAPVAPFGWLGNEGWAFGEDVHESEVYATIEGVSGVDHVESLILFSKKGNDWITNSKRIGIESNSLVFFDEAKSSITVRSR